MLKNLFILITSFIILNEQVYAEADSLETKNHDSISDIFYTKINKRASKNNLTKEIVNLFIKEPKAIPNVTIKETKTRNNPYNYIQGRYVRNIYVKRLEPLGTYILDTSITANKWYDKAGNFVHFKTLTYQIKKNLLFKEGDAIELFTLSDNERILREMSSVEDALFIADTSFSNDSADITVLVKDVWNYGLGVAFSSVSKGNADLNIANFMGLGIESKNEFYWDENEGDKTGYIGYFRFKNIAKTFFDINASYINKFNTYGYTVRLDRGFYTPETKYAAGASIDKNIGLYSTYYSIDSIITVSIDRYVYDAWLSRAFTVNPSNKNKRGEIVLSGRYQQHRFIDRPSIVDTFVYYPLHNRKYFLGSISYARQYFTKSDLIYSFGRTEDVAFGSLYSLTGGYEINEFYNRIYGSISILNGIRMFGNDYLQTGIQIGGFLHKNNFMQGVVRTTLRYYTPLMKLHNLKTRYFIDINYVRGIGRFKNEYITINNYEGITGATSTSFLGTEKLTFNHEIVFFSNLYFYGFRFVFFAYNDVGIINNKKEPLLSNMLYCGIGSGIRLRNERLVFNTIHIRLAYYPVVPSDAVYEYITMPGEKRLHPQNFYAGQPSFITY